MAYKLSQRHDQDRISAKNNDASRVDLGKIATVFIVFSLVSFVTAWFYSMETEQVANASFQPSRTGGAVEVGPLTVAKNKEAYRISVRAALRSQSWSQIEGEVLDSSKKYLFSFGQELSRYSGRDSDGAWSEVNNTYSINVTFPTAGTYYLKFDTESSSPPNSVDIKISKKRGSAIPHLWFGIFTLIIGIGLNEIRNRTIRNVVGNFES